MKYKYLLLVSTFIGFIAGCNSVNPLSDINNAKYDDRLIGTWSAKNNDATMYYHIGHKIHDKPYKLMQIVMIEHRDDKGLDASMHEGFSTRISDIDYMNIINLNGGYSFVKYHLIGETSMEICGVDSKRLESLVKNKRIKGKFNKRGELVQLNDTTERLAELLSLHEFKNLFSHCNTFNRKE